MSQGLNKDKMIATIMCGLCSTCTFKDHVIAWPASHSNKELQETVTDTSSQNCNADGHILHKPFRSLLQESCQTEFQKAGLAFQCQFQTSHLQVGQKSRLIHSVNRNYIDILVLPIKLSVKSVQHLPSQTSSGHSFLLHCSYWMEQRR